MNFNAEKREKMRNEASWTILHLKHKSLHFMDAAPAIRCHFMELGNRSSAKVQSNYWIWNDSNYYYFADDLFERPASNFSTPRRASWQVVSKIVRVVCTAIIWHLGPVNIKLPFTENEWRNWWHKSSCYSTMSWGNRWDSHGDQTTRNKYNRP